MLNDATTRRTITTWLIMICVTAVACAYLMHGRQPRYIYEKISRPWYDGSVQQVYRIEIETGDSTLIVNPMKDGEPVPK